MAFLPFQLLYVSTGTATLNDMCAPHPTESRYNTLALCLPVSVFIPLLFTLHAINTEATTTAPTTRTNMTATTAPTTAPGPLPDGLPLPVAGGSWDDVDALLRSEIPAIVSEGDARWHDATVPGETLGDAVIATPATKVIRDGTAVDISDEMELFMTSDIVHSKHIELATTN